MTEQEPEGGSPQDELDRHLARARRQRRWDHVALAALGVALGVLAVFSDLSGPFRAYDTRRWGRQLDEVLAAAAAFSSAALTVAGRERRRCRREVELRRRREAALAHRATHDPLTGLPNRALLSDRLAHALARLRREPLEVAVLFVDLDRYKGVNDRFGHHAGDAVLAEVADRLRAELREADTVARLGGDEFVVVCVGRPGDGTARRVAGRAVAALARRYEAEGAGVDLTASVGVASTTDPDHDAGGLLRRADEAVYRAKAQGGGRIVVAGPPGR